jgi:hypothetical protein
MQCLSCGFDNPEELKFCDQFSTPLIARSTPPQLKNQMRFNFTGTGSIPRTAGPSVSRGQPCSPQALVFTLQGLASCRAAAIGGTVFVHPWAWCAAASSVFLSDSLTALHSTWPTQERA